MKKNLFTFYIEKRHLASCLIFIKHKGKTKKLFKLGSSTTLTDGSQVIRINFSHLIYWLSSGTRLYLEDFQRLFPDLPLLFFIKK